MFAPKYFPIVYYPCRYFPPCYVSVDPIETDGKGQEFTLPQGLIAFDLPENLPQTSTTLSRLEFSLPENLLHFRLAGRIEFDLPED